MMKKTFNFALVGALSLTLLSACGGDDGHQSGKTWEAVQYKGSGPYTEERTAGSGVKYVLAMMAPRKETVLVPLMDKTVMENPMISRPPVMPPEMDVVPEPTIKNATPIFIEKMQK